MLFDGGKRLEAILRFSDNIEAVFFHQSGCLKRRTQATADDFMIVRDDDCILVPARQCHSRSPRPNGLEGFSENANCLASGFFSGGSQPD